MNIWCRIHPDNKKICSNCKYLFKGDDDPDGACITSGTFIIFDNWLTKCPLGFW